MALTKNRRIPSNHFSGQSNLQTRATDSLGAIVRGMLIREARILSAALTYPGGSENITDNSAGIAGILFTAAVTDLITPAAVDAESFRDGDGPYQLSVVGAALTGGPNIVIATDTDDFTRDAGSWIDDGFKVGQTVTVTESASNNSAFTVSAVVALTLTVSENLTDEGSQSDLVMTAPAIIPAGLAISTDYWVRRVSATTFKLYATKAAAIDRWGTAVDITSTGAADTRLLAIGQPTAIATDDGFDDTDSFTAVTGDTSFDTLMDAYAVLEDYIDAGLLAIGAGTLDPGPGTVAVAGTVAAIDQDVAANSSNTTGVTFASVLAIVTEIENSQKTLIDAINILRVAIGLAVVPVASNVLGTVDEDGINGGDAISTCTTSTAITILASATEAGIEIWLAGMADNVAFLADMCDAIGDVAADTTTTQYAGS